MSQETNLFLDEITRFFGEGPTRVVANQKVSLTVKKGEKMLLVGPSGSGKTTLLQIAGCLLRPSKGQVFLNGRMVSHLPQTQLAWVRLTTVGFVFQSFNLLPLLTAWENVALPGWLAGLPRRQVKNRAHKILADLGLKKRLNHQPGELSGGEKQRVAVARALINDPQLILADEPTANLDRASGQRVIELLCRQVGEEKKRSLVFASHDERIKPFVDQVVTMEDGKIIKS